MPVIVKRARPHNYEMEDFSAPAQTLPQSIPDNPVSHSVIESSAPSVPQPAKTEIHTSPQPDYGCDCDVPLYFYNPLAPLFNLLWLIILVILISTAIIIAINVVLGSFMGIMLFLFPKSQRCKKCGKIYTYNKENKDQCPYCGAKIQDDIIPH